MNVTDKHPGMTPFPPRKEFSLLPAGYVAGLQDPSEQYEEAEISCPCYALNHDSSVFQVTA